MVILEQNNYRIYGMRPDEARKALQNETISLKVNMYVLLVILFIAAFVLNHVYYEKLWKNASQL